MTMRANDNPERFRNRAAALVWLQSKGQISRGKFYDDCAAGHLLVNPDKTLSKFQVAEYAEKVFKFSKQAAPTKAPSKTRVGCCGGVNGTCRKSGCNSAHHISSNDSAVFPKTADKL